ncbi:MAG: hypothetical protein ACREPB_04045, partial [Arenimonas sp.]
EGFLALSPDGKKYYFDHMYSKQGTGLLTKIVQSLYSYESGYGAYNCSGVTVVSNDYEMLNAQDGGSGGGCTLEGGTSTSNIKAVLYRSRYFLVATRVEDAFGNWVNYNYNSTNKLTSIVANDGRTITLTYGTAHPFPISATANGRTWAYTYDTTNQLVKVTQPDGRYWAYAQSGNEATGSAASMNDPEAPYSPCYDDALFGYVQPQPDPVFTYSITHPSGATGEFKFAPRLQGKSNAIGCEFLAVSELSISSKKIMGAGLPNSIWTFSYGPENSSTQTKIINSNGSSEGLPNDCTTMVCVTTVNTQITNPDGTVQKLTFGTRIDQTDGQLQEAVLTKNVVVIYKENYQYVAKDPAQAGFATKVGDNPKIIFGSISTEFVLPQKKRIIEQDGATFTWQVNHFDPFGRPDDIIRFSSLGYSKNELLTYHDNRSNWTLGQLASLADVASGKIEVFRNFDANTALITSQLEFGQTVGTYIWNADGTLASARDANNNLTSLSNYHRGIPQRITYADTSFETGVVNDNGWITSMTDVRSNTTGFIYDTMGRLTNITPPAGDTVAWNSTDFSFAKLATPAYGVPAGGWKYSISKGNYRKETYMDAMWRPVVTREYDNSNIAGTQRFTRNSYDTEGRVVFASYPGAGDLITQGVRTEFDGLGRTTKVMQDSELGVLTSSTEYLAGFKTKTINPRGYFSLTSYMAWDSPDANLPMRIEAAEDSLTVFTRDGFGKPLTVTRSSLSDASITNTRIYAYDAQQRLCQRTEPESGSTVVQYDAFGNVLWNAPGQTVANTTACNPSAVPSTARVLRTYDVLNRLKTVDVPNSTNDLSYTYSGGLLQTLSNGGVVWNYTYNKLAQPLTETLTLDGRTKVISHRYNVNGVEDQLTLPSNLAVAYSPNALGQASQAGTFATGATYRSNGDIRGFNYGNGIVHKQLPNVRGLTASSQDLLANAPVFDEIMAYDSTGNVLCIRDNTSGNGGHRDMQYDGLDRLIGTKAPHQWWDSSEYVYDALDNIRFHR